MPKVLQCSISLILVTLTMCAGSTVEPSKENDSAQDEPITGASANDTGGTLHAAIVSMDVERNAPMMVWADHDQAPPLPAHDTPEAAARWFLEQHASLYRLSRADLRAAYVHRVHDVGRGGVIVIFRQRVGDLEVVRNDLKVLMTRDLKLVALTGILHDGVDHALAKSENPAAHALFRHPPAEAVMNALGDLYGLSLAGGVRQVGIASEGPLFFDLGPGTDSERGTLSLITPAQVIPVYFPVAGRLVPAYSVEVLAARAGDEHPQGYEYVIDADDGRVLHRRNRISKDVYSYQVWADAEGTPLDGPQERQACHPSGDGAPGCTEPTLIPSRQVSKTGLVHSDGGVDLWLQEGATHTTGNNVRAYADHYDPDGFTSGIDKQATVALGTRNFHDVYDTSLEPLASETQTHAAIVQSFYTTNWLHDYFYTSGFDESAGNAQDNNYSRGGKAGDALLVEAQNLGPDPRQRNNALIYTPMDGVSPQMELYLWETPEERSFTVSGSQYKTGKAAFGAQKFKVVGANLVLASDKETSSDGCEPPLNDVAGAIVMADRGNCLYELKAVNAENAGAVGLIILNHVPGDPPPDMFDVDTTLNATIPVLSLSYEDGQALKAMLASGAVEGAMERTPSIERDGAIDNTIIAHEWGHLLHHRLVECSTPQCRAQSEGWGDFIALHMMARHGDDLDGTYGIASYAAHILGESVYYGIRRAPYSRDSKKNAFRFRHIADGVSLPREHPIRDSNISNSEVHNAGEIWAAMLFDGYLALLAKDRRDSSPPAAFDETKRRMADYVVASMALAPPEPTFTEQRDALLMAARCRNPEDMLLLAQAFAGRGAGSCAVSPPRDSTAFTEVKEDYTLRPDLRLEFVQTSDTLRSCDRDSVLDAEEAGHITLKVTNWSPVTSTDATLRVSTTSTRIRFPAGTKLDVGEVAPFSYTTLRIPLELDPSLPQPHEAILDVVLSSPTACQDLTSLSTVLRLNYDLFDSHFDTVESPKTTWSAKVLEGGSQQSWRIVRSSSKENDHVWYANDGYEFADTTLETPLIEVASSEDFILNFEHRHSFAQQWDPQTGQNFYWNGGVIELSRDNGNTWEDVRAHTAPGYGGTLATNTGNNLEGRLAYAAKNPSWPMTDTVVLNFGKSFKDKSVKLRFRLGSAWVFEDHGWELDNISVQGSKNQPFLIVGNDTSSCTPLADAGDDQTVFSSNEVLLDGSRSSDSNGDTLTYSWVQTSGPEVTLQAADSVHSRFTAPAVADSTRLTFNLHVSDGTFMHTDTMNVLVHPLPGDAGTPPGDAGTPPGDAGTPPGDAGTPPGDAGTPPGDGGLSGGGEGGCACRATGDGPNLPWPFWLLVGVMASTRYRRKHASPCIHPADKRPSEA
ncbi:M36 family metallopeptidase [Archangium sp. Cb G35]|uniref:M36 family metallopeptidase n=1 Tax=Archangium sp. Cb G35 TaxID=1920190 RepID=UPI00093675AB|nr:M36 family metallopeptidase [Archangium sp. Cb G35]